MEMSFVKKKYGFHTVNNPPLEHPLYSTYRYLHASQEAILA